MFTENSADERWRIQWPTPVEMERFASMVNANTTNELEKGGLNLQIKNFKDPAEQNAYYNDWLSGTVCLRVNVFIADGRVCFTNSNHSGSYHDARFAAPPRFLPILHFLAALDPGMRRNAEDEKRCAVITKQRQAAACEGWVCALYKLPLGVYTCLCPPTTLKGPNFCR